MALGTAALAGAAGPSLPTRALRRFRLMPASPTVRQSSRGCRSRLQTASSSLGLAPAPPPLPPSMGEAERGVQQQLNNLVPFPKANKSCGNSAAGGVVEQRQASVASPSAIAFESVRQQPTAAAQPAAAAGLGPIHGAVVRARRRSRLLTRTVPEAATPAGTAAMAGEEGRAGASSSAAAVLLRRQRASPRLSAAQEQELAAAVAAGGPEGAAAVVALVDANRPLVQHLARRFLGRGVDRQDLVGEGLLALERAAACFRPAGEARFSTYAAAVVWRAMQRAVHNHSRDVRLPAHQYFDMRRVRQATEELLDELDRQPSCAAIAQRCGFTLRYTVHLIRAMQARRRPAPSAAVQQGEASGSAATSDLDLACEDADQEQQEQFEALRAELHSCMHALTPKQQQVVTLRWGLLDGRPRTLKEVGDALGFTGSWASAQCKTAERKLRAIMAGEEQREEQGTPSERLASGAGAAVVAAHEQWAEAARGAAAAALPSLSPEEQLVLALRHSWLDSRKVMPSCESIATQLHRSKSWVVAKVRHAEQQLLRELARLQQQGAAPQLSPPLDPRCLARLAPFSPRQVRQWRQMLERIAAANAADARPRGGGSNSRGSGRSNGAVAGSRAAGSAAASGKAACAEAMSASKEHASSAAAAHALGRDGDSMPAGQACALDAGRRPVSRGASSAGKARSSAPAGSAAGKALRAANAQADSCHFEELVGMVGTRAGSAAFA